MDREREAGGEGETQTDRHTDRHKETERQRQRASWQIFKGAKLLECKLRRSRNASNVLTEYPWQLAVAKLQLHTLLGAMPPRFLLHSLLQLAQSSVQNPEQQWTDL